MKNCILSLLIVCPLFAFAQNNPRFIALTNSSSEAFVDKVVAIDWPLVVKRFGKIDTTMFSIVDATSKKEIPLQFETLGTGSIQNLLVQVSVPANSKKQLLIVQKRRTALQPKTYGRYVPERKDDFAWENDKIAFRMYGKALEGTNENAYGIDVWVKRVERLVINERYKQGNYHVDHGDGLDYYHVGYTLGAGNIMPYVNDSIWYSANYHQWQVMDNGPLRTTFKLTYDEWDVNGNKVSATKTISLDAGSHFNKITASYTFNNAATLPLVVGIIRRKNAGTQLLDEQNGIMAYWEPTDAKDGTTGVAVVSTEPVTRMMMTKDQLLLTSKTGAGKQFTYYTGAAWDKAGVFTNSEKWINYVNVFGRQVRNPLEVEIK